MLLGKVDAFIIDPTKPARLAKQRGERARAHVTALESGDPQG